MADEKLPSGVSRLRQIAVENAKGPGVPYNYQAGVPVGTPGAEGNYKPDTFEVTPGVPVVNPSPFKTKGG